MEDYTSESFDIKHHNNETLNDTCNKITEYINTNKFDIINELRHEIRKIFYKKFEVILNNSNNINKILSNASSIDFTNILLKIDQYTCEELYTIIFKYLQDNTFINIPSDIMTTLILYHKEWSSFSSTMYETSTSTLRSKLNAAYLEYNYLESKYKNVKYEPCYHAMDEYDDETILQLIYEIFPKYCCDTIIHNEYIQLVEPFRNGTAIEYFKDLRLYYTSLLIPIKEHHYDYDYSICPICQDSLKRDCEEINILSCNCKYIYHPKCIKSWLHKSSTCPFCKKKV